MACMYVFIYPRDFPNNADVQRIGREVYEKVYSKLRTLPTTCIPYPHVHSLLAGVSQSI